LGVIHAVSVPAEKEKRRKEKETSIFQAFFVVSDYLTDNAFVEAFLYEKKNGYFFLSFLFSKKEFFSPPQISVSVISDPLVAT
jgi:hypothetical protein